MVLVCDPANRGEVTVPPITGLTFPHNCPVTPAVVDVNPVDEIVLYRRTVTASNITITHDGSVPVKFRWSAWYEGEGPTVALSFLNEGIDEVWNLACGYPSAVAYDNGHARVGVGDSSTPPAETQTGLQGASQNFQPMKDGYPKTPGGDGEDNRVTFRAQFPDGQAEWSWQEFTVDNGSARNKNLLRIVADRGAKEPGDIWEVEVKCGV